MRTIKWFTLFFIPLIPYETKWMVLCPICSYGIQLDSEQVNKFRPIAETNQRLASGQITEQEYKAQIVALTGTTTPEQASTLPEAKVVAQEVTEGKSIYCKDCGGKLPTDGRFCTDCGSQINKMITPVTYQCPACDSQLNFKPWSNGDASFEICPHCGMQFGYMDMMAGVEEKRPKLYQLWREAWLANDKKPFPQDKQVEVMSAAAHSI